MSTEVLSVRIRKDLKKEAQKLGINIREVVEKALEKEIKEAKKRMLREIIEKGLENMNVSVNEWIRDVKESRRER
ncbi:MAG: type II toxin-antitoxin system CcdA family antitoxin [Thermoprotei archaeon]|nr:type II toxin-antitoxin system CcdA family antitoxin [Thermoprotei archaeon]